MSMKTDDVTIDTYVSIIKYFKLDLCDFSEERRQDLSMRNTPEKDTSKNQLVEVPKNAQSEIATKIQNQVEETEKNLH